MCGIVGRLNFDGAPVDRAELLAARERMAHRGPDDAGAFVDGAVGLAHRRLAILDLSPLGAQPMGDATGRVHVTYNGEVYNFRELRAELERLGHAFRSGSDTEVILEAYRTWGIDCVTRFNGMFALGLWDADRQRLFLARDRLGVKPLYYALDRRRIVFASTVAPLLAFGDMPRELDDTAIGLYFQLSCIPHPFSIFRGVRKLRAGSILEVAAGGEARERRYWALAQRDPTKLSEGQALDRLETLLREAVAYRLISDVPVGAFLSGGIDSSLVVALMRELSDEVRTFTIGFTEREFDESRHARAVAEHLGTRHTELVLRSDDLLPLLDEVPRHYDEPFADASAIPTLAL